MMFRVSHKRKENGDFTILITALDERGNAGTNEKFLPFEYSRENRREKLDLAEFILRHALEENPPFVTKEEVKTLSKRDYECKCGNLYAIHDDLLLHLRLTGNPGPHGETA